jgi:hypothetical protein
MIFGKMGVGIDRVHIPRLTFALCKTKRTKESNNYEVSTAV